MPRASRITQSGILHYVISKGNGNQDIFRDIDDHEKYLTLLKGAISSYPMYVYNYVLLKSAIHLLVEPKQDNTLSKVMESVTREYAKYFNQKYNSMGHVFAGRFKSFAVQPDQYFLVCSKHIDLSPVSNDLVSEAKDYTFSGYGELAYGQVSNFDVDLHEIYKKLGASDQERQLVYRSLINQYFGAELDLNNRKGGILGSKEFKNSVKSGVNNKDFKLN
ncbi:MAG: transposase [Candidatus Omnitrophica bacterium]|nr:transposase [Candidatus Omnitrophota bacterium]